MANKYQGTLAVEQTNSNSLSKEELYDIVDRIETAIKEAGVMLCTVE